MTMREKKEILKTAFEYLRSIGVAHTQKDVSKKMNISTSNLSKAFSGNLDYLTDNFLSRFNESYNNVFCSDWLLTGEGEMLNNTCKKVDETKDFEMVPLINKDSVGGMHSLNKVCDSIEYVEKYIPFQDSHSGDLCIVETGDSMSPTCPPGSILLIRNVPYWYEFFGYGNIFVIELKDGRRITKEICRYDENPKEYVWCHSHNSSVPDEELPKSMIVSVWKVIKILTDKGW